MNKIKQLLKISTIFLISILVLNFYTFSNSQENNITYAATTKKVTKKATTTKKVTPVSKLPKIPAYSTSVWIPYWRAASGTIEATKNINKIDIISPFSYEVDETGVLKDKIKSTEEPFVSLLKLAKEKKKLVIPTILWTNGEAMNTTLNDEDFRGAIKYDIVQEVKSKGYDGIDIDFEGKKAETREGFSKFLTDLSADLHKVDKLLVCTIESRTPVESRYATVTPEILAKIQYSNDFKTIGSVCDQVRFMSYDQSTADVQLNTNKQEEFGYNPVADIDWVEKVITLAMWDIPWSKIVIGVPTYGYKYEINTNSAGKVTYKKIGSMNYKYAKEKADELKITPTRNKAGELSYTYEEAGKKYLVWYSDADAIADKVNLAKLYKIGGIAIFKIDGANDSNIWNKL